MQLLQKMIDQGKRVFVFLGESGSGKSEVAINWALMLAATGKAVRFFDMDQTKPLFRSRELGQLLQQNQIVIDEHRQFLDSPTVPPGVYDRIENDDAYVILDVGGNATGARSIGQLYAAWGDSASAYMVMNYYRPFSGNPKALLVTMESIAAAARLDNIQVISSPHFGKQTTLEDIVTGHKATELLLKNTRYSMDILAVLKNFEQEAQTAFPKVGILGITRYIKATWEVEYEQLVQKEE